MDVCLCHIEVKVRNLSSQILPLYVVKKDDTRKTYPRINSPIHGEHNSTKFNSIIMLIILFCS